jgi:hypothetical protein
VSAPDWIHALGDRDPSVPIALAAITRAAGTSDVVDFDDLVMTYREAHIACYRDFPGPGQTDITATRCATIWAARFSPGSPPRAGSSTPPRRAESCPAPGALAGPEPRRAAGVYYLLVAAPAVQRAKSLSPQPSAASVLRIDLQELQGGISSTR